MSNVTLTSARQFIAGLELPEVKHIEFGVFDKSFGVEAPGTPVEAGKPAPFFDFDAHKNQAVAIPSEIISFAKGVTVERRKDISNCALLAQLAANHQVKDPTQIEKWYDAYFEVLANLGWVIQDKGFSSHEEKAEGVEAHEVILKVATTLLGSAPTALAIVTSTIQAMKDMDKDNPWITIFDREIKKAMEAKFQIALAEEGENGQFLVNIMAFSLKAKSNLTQILFIIIRKDEVNFKYLSSKVTISDEVLNGVRDLVEKKLIDRTRGKIGLIDID